MPGWQIHHFLVDHRISLEVTNQQRELRAEAASLRKKAEMDRDDAPVSHVDLYHKLGKLEGLMQTMTSSMSAFQSAIMDIHGRIDALEKRQSDLENKRSLDRGALSAITGLGRDFAIPIAAIMIAWLVARGEVAEVPQRQPDVPDTHHNSPKTK